MTGVLEISEDKMWIPSNRIFDYILERIAAVLEDDHPKISEMLLLSTTERGGGYIDLSKCEDAIRSKVIDAADLAYQKFKAAGPESFSQPEFYPAVIRDFDELRELLHGEFG